MQIGVVFDFDGVLVDTEPLHLAAFQAVLGSRGLPLGEREYYDLFLGFDDAGTFREYERIHHVTIDDIPGLMQQKTEAFIASLQHDNVFYDGSVDTVRRLGDSFPLAIASGSRRDEILTILKAAGLADAFIAIVSADDVVRSKPFPDAYVAAAAALGFEPRRCLAIEDSPGGLGAARAAGLRTVGVLTTSSRSALADADHIVDRVSDVTAELVRQIVS
jgi:HAD superfamily hydrolase (TIGR01509 family)